jgi:hypothetical protein
MTLGKLIATERWVPAAGGAPAGTFYHVSCASGACPPYREVTLNSTEALDVAAVDLSAVGASESVTQRGYELIRGSVPGLIVAGENRDTRVGGLTLTATQFYFKAGRAF